MSIARRLFRGLLPLLILGSAILVVAALMATRPETVPVPAEERAWPVEAVQAVRGAHAPILRLHGFIESPRAATLRSAVEADVAEVLIREGDSVAAGDPLIRLDPEELELALRERRAEVADLEAQLAVERQRIVGDRRDLESEERLLAIVRREMERISNLASEAFTSQAEVDQVSRNLEQQILAVSARRLAVASADARLAQLEARLQRAQALAARAELNLARSNVAAPFDGRIADLHVAPGDRVGPGEVLVALYDSDALEIRAMVTSTHVARLRQALQTGELEAHAVVDGASVPVRLSRLAGRADPGQGGLDALFAIPPGADLLLGRFATLELTLPAEPDSVLLPFEALYETTRIYRVRDGRMEAVSIERIGEARMPDGRRGVLVRSDVLQDNDLVVVTQLPQAMEGLSVRAVERGDGT
ncbi:multidrug efflux pump subunit AcrA (membrane-fusion protein) [Natronocella acetinitrilica]|uniref:Multidrug efflux pump subunit AcrA (Membrane-fusion protein) n=1 Tax=Natronocella acetinitrilica TaxID=414046 RepID=A0AAE3KHM1_9GAMM|nr:biotin/lipoyl-binding protein [Natronocella acetinitrilica]MCP1676492.1 multidrug efflux pump subunit AcrA (membrane-fusion protein) [Natronocella acetinitrilica]